MNIDYTNSQNIKDLYSDKNRILKRGEFLKKYSHREISIRDLTLTKMPNLIDKCILDFGCGNGSFLKKIAGNYPENIFLGMDVVENPTVRNFDFLEYIIYDGHNYPILSQKPNFILSMNVLYHIEDHNNLFKWFKSILGKEGTILLTTKSINNFSYFNHLILNVLKSKIGLEPEIISDEQAFNVENSGNIIKNSFTDYSFHVESYKLKTKLSTDNYDDLLDYMFSCNKYSKFEKYRTDVFKEMSSLNQYTDYYTEILWVIQKR